MVDATTVKYTVKNRAVEAIKTIYSSVRICIFGPVVLHGATTQARLQVKWYKYSTLSISNTVSITFLPVFQP